MTYKITCIKYTVESNVLWEVHSIFLYFLNVLTTQYQQSMMGQCLLSSSDLYVCHTNHIFQWKEDIWKYHMLSQETLVHT